MTEAENLVALVEKFIETIIADSRSMDVAYALERSAARKELTEAVERMFPSEFDGSTGATDG